MDRSLKYFKGNRVESCWLGVVREGRGQSKAGTPLILDTSREYQGSWWVRGRSHTPRGVVRALISSYLSAYFQIKEAL